MNGSETTILNWLSVLSDSTRVRVLRLLERQELTVAELCAILRLPQSTVSRHLKVLADEDWARSRREGTSRFYRVTLDDLDPTARRLWLLIREQTADDPAIEQDQYRLGEVLTQRQTRSQAFFASTAGQWDKLRHELFGERFDLLAMPALMPADWTVGDLGCGTAQIARRLAPYVKRVIAVDSSPEMLDAARDLLEGAENVELKRGELERLPIDDQTLNAAVFSLVLHHVPDPGEAIAEAARTLAPAGHLLIVDMMRHDRREYQQQMGHVWLGFDREQVEEWCEAAGLEKLIWRPVPAEPDAKGPGLFVAKAGRDET